MRLIGGLQIIVDPYMPQKKESHRQERKWAHRVMYQRGRRFNIQEVPVYFVFDGKIVCHPAIAERLVNEVSK